MYHQVTSSSRKPLPIEKRATQKRFNTFTRKIGPESGHGCLLCIEFARPRSSGPTVYIPSYMYRVRIYIYIYIYLSSRLDSGPHEPASYRTMKKRTLYPAPQTLHPELSTSTLPSLVHAPKLLTLDPKHQTSIPEGLLELEGSGKAHERGTILIGLLT